MQWYQHTRAAQMQLVIEECLGQEPQAQRENDEDETRREQFICPVCGTSSLWVIYDPKNPVAGCVNGECPVEVRMGLLDTLGRLWDEDRWGDLPEGAAERKSTLGRMLGDLSAHYLREEESSRQEAFDAERRRCDEALEDRDRWKATAKQWKSRADDHAARVRDLEGSYAELEAQLHRSVDERALRRGLWWGGAALILCLWWIGVYLHRAEAGMLLAWGAWKATFYVLTVSAVCSYLAFSSAYRDTLRAKVRNARPSPLHERLNWELGLRWAGKVAVCVVLPYITVGIVGRSGLLAALLPRTGIEWLLVSTVAGVSCVFALCTWMAEDLKG